MPRVSSSRTRRGTKRKDVTRRSRPAASQLLWRRVFRRHGPDERERGPRLQAGGVQEAGHAEIEQLHGAAGTHEDVRRLEVAVHDAAVMCVLHGGATVAKQGQPAGEGQLERPGIVGWPVRADSGAGRIEAKRTARVGVRRVATAPRPNTVAHGTRRYWQCGTHGSNAPRACGCSA
jgi:hypothetical protein